MIKIEDKMVDTNTNTKLKIYKTNYKIYEIVES